MKHTGIFKKRAAGSSGYILLSRIIAIIASAVVVALICILALVDKSKFGFALKRVFVDQFFGSYGFRKTIETSIPLIIVTIGICVAFKMKLWNIGGNGQITMGAVFASAIPIMFPNLPDGLFIPVMFIAAFLGGAFWASLCAVPKALLNVNETISSLMLNYVAVYFVTYLVQDAWKDPNAHGFAKTPDLPVAAKLPMIGGSNVSYALFIALILLVLYYIIINKSKWGYEVRVTGENPAVAQYAGMTVGRNMMLTFIISGGVAGLAGYAVLAGSPTAGNLTTSIAGGMGFTAVTVAWLSRLNPIAVLFMSIFITGITNGAAALQGLGVDSSLAELVRGIILLMVLAFDVMTRYEITPIEKLKAKVIGLFKKGEKQNG